MKSDWNKLPCDLEEERTIDEFKKGLDSGSVSYNWLKGRYLKNQRHRIFFMFTSQRSIFTTASTK